MCRWYPMQTAPCTSRAVLRTIEAGNNAVCMSCGEPVKFKAKVKANQVICNVYTDGHWDRVEHFHEACYGDGGAPYGEPRPASSPGAAAPEEPAPPGRRVRPSAGVSTTSGAAGAS